MSPDPLIVAYREIGQDEIQAIRPLWEKLRAHHSALLAHFSDALPPFDFESRRKELLAKAIAGKMRLELAGIPGGLDIAYCVSTISASGRGEVDSMFVEESYRNRGIGTELCRRALNWLQTTGASSKVVTVAHDNAEALAFYKRFGFHARAVVLEQASADGEASGSKKLDIK